MADTHRVIITVEALSDLRGIVGFIRKDSPQAATGVAKIVLTAIDSLASMPHRFRLVGKSRRRGNLVRAMVVYPFIVYYRIDDNNFSVHILHVIHGARRQPKKFD